MGRAGAVGAVALSLRTPNHPGHGNRSQWVVGAIHHARLALPGRLGARRAEAQPVQGAMNRHRTLSAASTALAAAALTSVSGCGSSPDRGAAARAGRIDERAGTYRGVGLDDSAARVKRVFGKPAPFRGDLSPVGHNFYDDGAPVAVQKPPSHRRDGALRYRTASFDVADGTVYGVEVVEQGARTNSRIRIGEPLASARRKQPGLRCGTALEGTDYQTFPYCTGKVAPGIYMWIGQDPVASITLAHKPLLN